MPLALIAIGLIAIVTVINGTFKDLFAQLQKDFTGQFLYWVAAVIIVGSIGYIPGWEKPSRMFLALVIVALILANAGLWQKLTQALQTGATPDQGGVPLAAINTAPAVGSTSPNTAQLQGIVGTASGVAANIAANLPTTTDSAVAQTFGLGTVVPAGTAPM